MARVPLYERVREAVAASIADGTYTAGDKLPSESRLADELRVNRLTVRRALEDLALAGVVVSRQGSGTFVSAPIARLPLLQRTTDSLAAGIAGQIAEHGYAHEMVLLCAARLSPPPLDTALELPSGSLWRIDDALMVDGAAWMWSSSWFGRSVLADPAESWDNTSGLSGLLDVLLGELRPIRRNIYADAATAEDAQILAVRKGSPILVHDGLTADDAGNVVLRVIRRARMDRFSYLLQLN